MDINYLITQNFCFFSLEFNIAEYARFLQFDQFFKQSNPFFWRRTCSSFFDRDEWLNCNRQSNCYAKDNAVTPTRMMDLSLEVI